WCACPRPTAPKPSPRAGLPLRRAAGRCANTSCCQMMSLPTNAGSASGSGERLPMAKRCRPRNLSVDDDRQRADAADEVGIETARRARDLELEVALQDLLPQNFQLHFRQSIADAAMDAGAEGQMLARLGPPDHKALGPLDRGLVTVARHVPHHHLVALPDRPAG